MKALGRPARVVIVAYALALAAYLVLRWLFGGDLWWLALLNNIAPYYFLPLPGLLLLAVLLRLNWRYLLPPLVLLVIGLLWFGPLFLPRPQPAPAENSIRLTSLNVWFFNERTPEMEVWLRSEPADIVLLQEAYYLLAYHLSDLYSFSVPDLTRHYQDLLILSRYPVLESTSGSGYQRAVIDIDGIEVAVYNVHFGVPFASEMRLALGGLPRTLDMVTRYDERPRNAQIDQLLAALESENLPFIVGGDFNISDHSVKYETIAARLTDSYRETATGFGATWPVGFTLPLSLSVPPFMRLDYVLHSDELRTLSSAVGPDVGSDHLPLMVRLALTASP